MNKVYVGRPHRNICEAVIEEVHQTRITVKLLEDHPRMEKGGYLRVPKEMCYEENPGEKTYDDLVEDANTAIRERCSLDDPPHWLAHPDHYLTGTKLNKDGRERDAQRQRLYRAEHDCGYTGVRLDDIQEARAYISGLSKYPWFKNRFGTLDHLEEVRTCRSDARRSHAKIDEIALAGFRIWTILHEITHTLVPPPHPAHGPLFAKVLLEITRHILASDLESSYKKFSIRYKRTDHAHNHGRKKRQQRV